MKHTMLLTGDVNLRNVTDPDRPFAHVAETLQGADIVFGNLEGCLYDSEEELPYKTGWRHAGTAGARALVRGGFHAVGCANNVTFGHEAIVSSLAQLDEMGVEHTGTGVDRASAGAQHAQTGAGCMGVCRRNRIFFRQNGTVGCGAAQRREGETKQQSRADRPNLGYWGLEKPIHDH